VDFSSMLAELIVDGKLLGRQQLKYDCTSSNVQHRPRMAYSQMQHLTSDVSLGVLSG
jgi:hypothetical protein